MNPFKNNFLTEKFAGTPDAAQPRLSEAGREGVEARRQVRHNGYKNAYNAIIRMYPELVKVPAVTANVAAAAVQAANTAPQYPLPVNTGEKYAAAPSGAASDKFSEPEVSPSDWITALENEARVLMEQNNGAEQ